MGGSGLLRVMRQIDSKSFSRFAVAGSVALIGGAAFALWIDGVPKRAEDAKPLEVGKMVPEAKVVGLDGKETTTATIAKMQPTVFVFYRGGWCPFCNRHLAELRNAEAGLKEMGYQLVALTPDLPEELKKTMTKEEVGYKIFSDSSAAAMKAFGVAFELDQKTVSMYKESYKIDVERASGQTHHILPVPSVFISNGSGEIKFVYSNVDYKVRLSSEAVLEAAKNAKVW